MAGSVRFDDFSIKVVHALESAVDAYLHEASGELVRQTQRNTRVDTGQLKGSWQYKIDGNTATIGSPLENAIWEEFGTGEYALEGNGRKGGWYVPAEKLTPKAKSKMRKVVIKNKEFYFTRGKTPSRAFHTAFNTCKPKLIKRAEEVLQAHMG